LEAAYDALLHWALTDPWFRDVLVPANREDDLYTAMLYRDNDKKPSFRMRKP
jgi:hypothetical protein